MARRSPASPVVPRFGVAVACLHDGEVVAANPLWQALGPLRDAPPPARPHILFAPLRFAGHRLPVWVAVAPADASRHWPGLADLAPAPSRARHVRHLLAFVPSRDAAFPALAARVFRLGEPERQTLGHVLASHDIADLAQRLGISEAGARKRVAALYRGIGVAGLAGLNARTTRLLTDEFVSDQQHELALQAVFGLTAAQAGVARLVSAGHSLPDIAGLSGLSPHTVRDHARATLEKAAAPRLKDLAQMANEAAALYTVALGSDGLHHDRGGLLDATQILHRGSRQIGIADYGPAGATPLLYCHGGMGMRRVGDDLRRALQARGFRPIGIDRPGFGLSDAAGHDHFATAADDMARALDGLGLDAAVAVSTDGGAPAALGFWQRHGTRLISGALISPRPPAPAVQRAGKRVVDRFARAAMERPDLINGLWQLVRRRAGTAMAGRLAERLFGGHPVDAALLADPIFRSALIAELLSCGIRSGAGISAEQSAYRRWQPAPGGPPRRWQIIVAADDPLWAPMLDTAADNPWAVLGQPAWHRLAGAGRFAITSHAAEIAAIIADT